MIYIILQIKEINKIIVFYILNNILYINYEYI